MGKQCRVRFKISTHKTNGILDYMHSDILGPVRTPSKRGAQYFMSFIDDYSRKAWVYFLKNKSEAFAKFKIWKAATDLMVSCNLASIALRYYGLVVVMRL